MSDRNVAFQVMKIATTHKYLPILVSFLLCTLVAGLWAALKNHENRNRVNIVKAQAIKIADVINVDLNNRITSLQRVIKRWEVRGGTPKHEFINDVQSYLEDYPGYQVLSWVDKTYHVRWSLPLAGNESAVNLNLAFEDSRRIALEKSRDNKLPTLTSPIELVQGVKGLLVYSLYLLRVNSKGF